MYDIVCVRYNDFSEAIRMIVLIWSKFTDQNSTWCMHIGSVERDICSVIIYLLAASCTIHAVL